MDPAKRNLIIKNLFVIILVLLFLIGVAYGIFIVLSSLAKNEDNDQSEIN